MVRQGKTLASTIVTLSRLSSSLDCNVTINTKRVAQSFSFSPRVSPHVVGDVHIIGALSCMDIGDQHYERTMKCDEQEIIYWVLNS